MNQHLTDGSANPEWLAQRVGKITGSRIGAILGLNPYRSADDVLREMVREALGAEDETVVTEAMRYGTQREPAIKDRLRWEHDIEGKDVGFVPHPTIPWLGVSPDWIEPGVEIKAPYSGNYQPLASRLDYAAQINLCMACTDTRNWFYVVELASDKPLEITLEIIPDGWLKSVLPSLEGFMRRYEAALKDPAEHLEPKVQEREDDVWVAAALAYRQAKHDADAAIRDLAECRRRLEEMADGRTCRGGGVRVSQIKGKGTLDYKAMAEAGVDVEAYRKEGKASVRVTVEGG